MVAIARRSAPMMFIDPSDTRDGPEQDLLERADGADPDPLAARQLAVVGLGAPVEAAARRLGGPGQRRADHHGVSTAGDRLGDVAARPRLPPSAMTCT